MNNTDAQYMAEALDQAKKAKQAGDLPQLLRPRKILMKSIAEDSGYDIKITTGVLKGEIRKEFDGVVKK